MTAPESDPTYLAHTIEAFLAAMREAEGLADSGDSDELRDVLRHADELLDIVAEGVSGLSGGAVALRHVDALREKVNAARDPNASAMLH